MEKGTVKVNVESELLPSNITGPLPESNMTTAFGNFGQELTDAKGSQTLTPTSTHYQKNIWVSYHFLIIHTSYSLF